MGYLDNTSLTVDAILTNRGRAILAQGGQLSITKFALADDEVDYRLWNPAHSLGSNYYGAAIEAMPILEAVPDEVQMMKSKLITLPRTATGVPVLTLTGGPTTFTALGQTATITANVTNIQNPNSALGYTAILSDNTVASLEPAPDSVMTTGQVPTYITEQVGTSPNSVTRMSKGKFIIKPKSVAGTKTALLTVYGNETGGFGTIMITVSNTRAVSVVTGTNTQTS